MSTKPRTTQAVLGLVLVAAFGCSVPGSPLSLSASCAPETEVYLSRIEPLLAEWYDSVHLADSTPRIALSPLVQDLQDLRREVDSVPSPGCAQGATGLLSLGMDEVIAGFIDFMSELDDVIVEARLHAGTLAIANATEQLDALAMGIPAPPDVNDDDYAQCARQAADDARQLSGEMEGAFSQAALSRNYVDFCRRLEDRISRANELQAAHSQCPEPQDAHLQAARIWLGMAHSDCVSSASGFASWCRRDPQTLTAMDCWAHSDCESSVGELAHLSFCIESADRHLRNYGLTP